MHSTISDLVSIPVSIFPFRNPHLGIYRQSVIFTQEDINIWEEVRSPATVLYENRDASNNTTGGGSFEKSFTSDANKSGIATSGP